MKSPFVTFSLFATFLLAHVHLVSSKVDKQNESILLMFDDIQTTGGMATVPFPYSHLSFSSFDVFAPKDSALSSWISESDFNCARSAPNALIGSRSGDAQPASISIANATLMSEAGFNPHFTLKSFSIKPMDAPPGGVTVSLLGFTETRNTPLNWYVNFPYGYHLPFLVKLQDYSKDKWEQLHKVEITADFGPDRLDWEFCSDNLEIQFTEKLTLSETSKYNLQGPL